jgi:tetratricopeptide (TPR) repeat protein
MIIKNELLEQSDNPERKSSLTLSFRLCFLFLIICILVPLARAETLSEDIDPISLLEFSLAPSSQNVNISNTPEYSKASFHTRETPMQVAKLSAQRQKQTNSNIAVNLPAKVDKEPSHLLIAQSPTTDLGHQLWQARISNPKDRKSSKSKSGLYQIIEKIRSVKFEQHKSAEPIIVTEPAQKTEPDETSSDSNVLQKPEPKKAEAEPQSPFNSKRQDEKQSLARQITDQTLEIFEQLSQQPQQLKNPFELAEILFCNGSLKEAEKCYQEALNRMAANESDRHEERAWVLFQIGNCLRNADQLAAIEMGRQLIAEYPDSPWADLAEARSKLINWYQQDKPRELIAENRF